MYKVGLPVGFSQVGVQAQAWHYPRLVPRLPPQEKERESLGTRLGIIHVEVASP